ncbi:MAG: hypothetical protein KC431_18275, partial [Myxococcales bacterium]|nr:hypothetical protein [Myxococcales bacterium]
MKEVAMSPDDAPVRPKVRARAFIVEDEWTIAQGLQLVLEDMGLQVEHLLRRYQDLEPLLAERPPDLILMDIALVDEVDG